MIPLFILVFCEIRPLLAPRVNQALYPVAGPDDPATSGSPRTKITLKGFLSLLLDDERPRQLQAVLEEGQLGFQLLGGRLYVAVDVGRP